MNRIGIIGGGQLGMFICQAAKNLGIKTSIFSKVKDFSAKKFCDSFFIGDFKDENILNKFIESADYFTIETENIPFEFLNSIHKKKKIFPEPKIVRICQNRLIEKEFLNSIDGVETANFFPINTFEDFDASIKKLNYQGILKTCEFGYDGKGQYKIFDKNINQIKKLKLNNFIIEEYLDFKLEISVIVCRGKNKIISYPVVRNIHKSSILRETIYPANISDRTKEKATNLALRITEEINLYGILAVEMFVMKNDDILINELAPRPHNSGHWTLDFCETSQFQNLIHTIIDGTPKSPKPSGNCKMINVIGNDFLNRDDFKEKYKFYDYLKEEIKPLRKMGHYTFRI